MSDERKWTDGVVTAVCDGLAAYFILHPGDAGEMARRIERRMRQMRDDYEAELAALRAERWQPVEDGEYMDDWGITFTLYESGNQLAPDSHRTIELNDIRLCHRATD